MQNTKSNKFYTFCPKNLPYQSSQRFLNIQNCYNNNVYLITRLLFICILYFIIFFSLHWFDLSLSLSSLSLHSLFYLPHQTCSLLNTKSSHIPIIKYFSYKNLSLQTQNSHTISTSNTSPTQTHIQDPHNLGFFSYLASTLVAFCGFVGIDVQAWGVLWVCWNWW